MNNADDHSEIEKLKKENKKLEIDLMARNKKLKEYRLVYEQNLMDNKKEEDFEDDGKARDDYKHHNTTKM